jgi:hypothetical protein
VALALSLRVGADFPVFNGRNPLAVITLDRSPRHSALREPVAWLSKPSRFLVPV